MRLLLFHWGLSHRGGWLTAIFEEIYSGPTESGDKVNGQQQDIIRKKKNLEKFKEASRKVTCE
jgi:hypothetical protein